MSSVFFMFRSLASILDGIFILCIVLLTSQIWHCILEIFKWI